MRAYCRDKRLAMTEGHYALPGRNRNEVLSSWGAGVSYARCHNVIMRHSDVLDIATLADFFGNRWQVNAIMLPSPIGSGPAYLQPVGTIMKLFRHHIGEYAIDVEKHIDGVDLAASISDDGKKIFLHAVNTSMDSSRNIELTVNGMLPKKAVAYTVASDPMTEVTPLNPDVFSVSEISIEGGVYTLPAAGVTAIELEF
jgi:alpha-L-arabinofuranosidase